MTNLPWGQAQAESNKPDLRQPPATPARRRSSCRQRANINTTQLETLALDRSAWQVTCATAVSQIHQTNQDRRSERRTQRHQRAVGIPLVSGFPCAICGRVCGSRIGLNAHEKWHQRQRR
ncbi:hypothetical protein SKAU_G00099580 [Synaphobranchus kaupii]|uniref:C2H2-type domain-containing protein n=1 Tax=Synaphobranchus kaupii TaxID=118154 RepID=A0A9Q1J548_SYNKA|nr:hypothetical protein SKAU_G00099580 [Synaphobranchus kaupii]